MEPNNIENQIREKLHLREIQPSAQAWDRLDAMLTVAEEKKTKKQYGFLFIAASIMVFLTVGMFLFTQKDIEMQPQNTVVGTEVEKDSIQKDENQLTPQNLKNQKVINNNQIVISQFQSSSKTQPNRIERSEKNQKTLKSKNENNQNQIIRDKEIEFQNSSDVALKNLPKIIDTKTFVLDSRPKINSDEQLLSSLDNITKQSINQKLIVKVDAKSLLSEVDGELEMTFREKVINKVSKNYKEVKVALANRNNE